MVYPSSSKLRGQRAVGVTIIKDDKDPVDPEEVWTRFFLSLSHCRKCEV